MKVLITGAGGMLGSALVPAFVSASHHVVATDLVPNPNPIWGSSGPALHALDVRQRDEVESSVLSTKPDLVLHLAAETSLERSDADPDHAFQTNTIATKYVALACRRAHVPLVYISTAGVFDGINSEPYTEFDRPNPINTYGASKYEGEVIIKELLDEYYILRAGWMVGGGPQKDHKFVNRILDQVRNGAETIWAVGDKYGTPTYTTDFAHCLLNLVSTDLFGLYHMACEGKGTRFDVAQHLLHAVNRPDISLVEVESSYFAEEFPSIRPRSEIMRNMALDLQGMNLMRPWRDALTDYVSTYYQALIRTSPRVSARVA
jgi:dTDP-4-dehydrorhamnose reductase